jgi:hypothetical protein
MLGLDDTNPEHPALDRSCAGEAEGPYRLKRGLDYIAYLRARHPGFAPPVVTVPGVGHDGHGMFTSACGIAVIFNQPLPAACKSGS